MIIRIQDWEGEVSSTSASESKLQLSFEIPNFIDLHTFAVHQATNQPSGPSQLLIHWIAMHLAQ